MLLGERSMGLVAPPFIPVADARLSIIIDQLCAVNRSCEPSLTFPERFGNTVKKMKGTGRYLGIIALCYRFVLSQIYSQFQFNKRFIDCFFNNQRLILSNKIAN